MPGPENIAAPFPPEADREPRSRVARAKPLDVDDLTARVSLDLLDRRPIRRV
jgi:hypothetical protein